MFFRSPQRAIQSFGRRLIHSLNRSNRLVNPYANNPTRKAQIERAVSNYAEYSGLNARGACQAVIGYEYVDMSRRSAMLIISDQLSTKAVPIPPRPIMSQ